MNLRNGQIEIRRVKPAGMKAVRRPLVLFLVLMIFNGYFNNRIVKNVWYSLSLGILWPLQKATTSRKNEFDCLIVDSIYLCSSCFPCHMFSELTHWLRRFSLRVCVFNKQTKFSAVLLHPKNIKQAKKAKYTQKKCVAGFVLFLCYFSFVKKNYSGRRVML